MNQVVLITGAGRGIGAATARLAAARGYAVAVNYRVDQASADGVVAAIRAAGGTAVAIRGDVAIEADVLRMFEQCTEALGPITALVNNAGVVDRKSRVEDYTVARIERMFAINVTGTIVCSREAVRRMSTARGGAGGAIVNLSSVASKLGSAGEYVDYAAAKAAIDTFTIGLAREVVDEGIRVNCVRPGIVRTEIHASGGQPDRPDRIAPLIPMQRPGMPDEIAHAVLWLLSDEASYVTATILDVSGGR